MRHAQLGTLAAHAGGDRGKELVDELLELALHAIDPDVRREHANAAIVVHHEAVRDGVVIPGGRRLRRRPSTRRRARRSAIVSHSAVFRRARASRAEPFIELRKGLTDAHLPFAPPVEGALDEALGLFVPRPLRAPRRCASCAPTVMLAQLQDVRLPSVALLEDARLGCEVRADVGGARRLLLVVRSRRGRRARAGCRPRADAASLSRVDTLPSGLVCSARWRVSAHVRRSRGAGVRCRPRTQSRSRRSRGRLLTQSTGAWKQCSCPSTALGVDSSAPKRPATKKGRCCQRGSVEEPSWHAEVLRGLVAHRKAQRREQQRESGALPSGLRARATEAMLAVARAHPMRSPA